MQFISNNAVVFINTYVPLCVCAHAHVEIYMIELSEIQVDFRAF